MRQPLSPHVRSCLGIALLAIAVLVLLPCGSLAASSSSSSESSNAWAMRWRVYANPEWGISFRFPYSYMPPDQYQPSLRRPGGGGSMSGGEGIMVPAGTSPEQIRALLKERLRSATNWDVHAFSVTADEVSAGSSLAATAKSLIKSKYKWDAEFTAFDYYANPEQRPHAHPKWAPEAIEAVIGSCTEGCVLVVKHGQRYSGLLCTGGRTEHDNHAILSSFEVMAEARRGRKVTWREAMTVKGHVIDADGNALKAKGFKHDNGRESVRWREAWEAETEHYHIMAHSHPQNLLYLAGYLEALYEAFVAVYNPDTVPHYKMEIHIMKSQQDFMTGSRANGIPVSQSTGGFFVPSWLCIYAYEESSKWGGEDFSVEHVLAHECSHQFLHVTCNGSSHVPTWINEGLAVYFENAVYERGNFKWRPPTDRLQGLMQQYQRSKSTLWAPEQYLSHYGHIDAAQYAEVYAITHFWIFGSNTGKAKFKEYWQALKNGEDGTESFERIFMEDMIKAQGSRSAAVYAWQQMLMQYVMGRNCEKQGSR